MRTSTNEIEQMVLKKAWPMNFNSGPAIGTRTQTYSAYRTISFDIYISIELVKTLVNAHLYSKYNAKETIQNINMQKRC